MGRFRIGQTKPGSHRRRVDGDSAFPGADVSPTGRSRGQQPRFGAPSPSLEPLGDVAAEAWYNGTRFEVAFPFSSPSSSPSRGRLVRGSFACDVLLWSILNTLRRLFCALHYVNECGTVYSCKGREWKGKRKGNGLYFTVSRAFCSAFSVIGGLLEGENLGYRRASKDFDNGEHRFCTLAYVKVLSVSSSIPLFGVMFRMMAVNAFPPRLSPSTRVSFDSR